MQQFDIVIVGAGTAGLVSGTLLYFILLFATKGIRC